MATEHRSRKVLQDLSVNKQKPSTVAGKENEKPSSATKRGTGFGIVSKPIDVGTKPATKSIPAVPVFSSATSSSSVSTSTTTVISSKPTVVPGKGTLTGTVVVAPGARSSSKSRKPLESKSGTKSTSKGTTAPKLLTQLPSNSKSTSSTSTSSTTSTLSMIARKFKFTSSSVPTESAVPESGTMVDNGPETDIDPSLLPEAFGKETEPGLEGSRGAAITDITADSEKDTSFRDSPEHLTKKQKEDSDEKMNLGLEVSLNESTGGWKDDGEDAEMEGATRTTGHIDSLAEVDHEDKNNPQMATDYIQDIMNYFRDVESRRQAKKNYMERQPDIDEDMREILVDWLIGVHSQFKLKVETLFLTINMIDRFLERKAVHRRKLQLVGCTCMFLSSKYEERHAPLITDFVYVSANNFSKPDVLEMEGHILNVLQFNLTIPSAYRFAQRYLRVAEADDLITLYTQFLLELTLPKYEYLKYLPSQTAATAVYIALKTTKLRSWDAAMVSQTQYSEAALEPSIRDLLNIANEKNPKCSVRRKFSSKKLQEVAKIPIWSPTKDKLSTSSLGLERSGSGDVLEERAF